MTLEEHRKRIDRIDEEILKLLEERVEEARKIGEEKRKAGKSVRDPTREDEVLEHVVRSTKLEPSFAKKIFKLIVEYCRNEQN